MAGEAGRGLVPPSRFCGQPSATGTEQAIAEREGMRTGEREQVMESRVSIGSRCDGASASREPQSHRWEMNPTPALCSQAQDR